MLGLFIFSRAATSAVHVVAGGVYDRYLRGFNTSFYMSAVIMGKRLGGIARKEDHLGLLPAPEVIFGVARPELASGRPERGLREPLKPLKP